jgi:uncharacterized protein YdeI (YjbR/CyaY-like superfamily)
MPPKLEIVEVRNREEWREWLRANHASLPGAWLAFHKGATSLGYDEAVEEALCFGWIDSIVKRLDERRYARKFTPRNPGSKWSSVNRKRYENVKAKGLLEAAGLERAPGPRSGDAPRPSLDRLPAYFESALQADSRAEEFFRGLAPSYRRIYVGWVDSAKRQETREKRLAEALTLLRAGKKPGLK